jgi:UDP-N-acetylmuramoyl-L-alanyl-D-glutamate--2,6-diaminopimelate ligase
MLHLTRKINSQEIVPGDIFVCLPGRERFIEDAMHRGASQVVHMTRTEWGLWVDEFYGHPSQKLCVVGVTGTNGKTTTTHIITEVLNKLGYKARVQGTINSDLTTPEAHHTHAAMAEHLLNGGTHFVMEVSSHAIHQDRISGIHFSARLLTNITQDHLDYHKTFENYRQVKLSFMVGPVAIKPDDYQKVELGFRNPLVGEFNVQNMKSVVAVLRAIGIPDAKSFPVLETVKAPPGRFETLDEGQDFYVIVDYAHTPDGLEKVAQEAQKMAKHSGGKTWIIFGCGGDRDRTKRPQMASIACAFGDHIVVTQDNPRTEDPEQIVKDIREGIQPEKDIYEILDRKSAIHYAISKANTNDVVLIAGKGHETYQIIGDEHLPFDDRAEARSALQNRLYETH